jgi:hypothetical protein
MRPLFPGYLFVAFAVERGGWRGQPRQGAYTCTAGSCQHADAALRPRRQAYAAEAARPR